MQSLYRENVTNRDLVVQMTTNTGRGTRNAFSDTPKPIDYCSRGRAVIGTLDETVKNMKLNL